MSVDIDQHDQAAARPPWIVWIGLAVVLLAAAVLSFDALRELARAVDIPAELGWLLPISIDAGAAVSCAIWLGGRTHHAAARFAGWMTWALLGVTVAGNAGQLGMHANRIEPPWWVAVAVGSIPPAIVGACVHLVVLLVRRAPEPLGRDEPTDDRPLAPWPTAPDGWAPPADTIWVQDEAGQALGLAPADEPVGQSDGAQPSADGAQPTDEYDRGLGGSATDDELIADMRRWAADRGRPVSRDDAVRAYGIGGPKARRLRLACGWPRGADEEADRQPADEPTAIGSPVG